MKFCKDCKFYTIYGDSEYAPRCGYKLDPVRGLADTSCSSERSAPGLVGWLFDCCGPKAKHFQPKDL